VRCETIVITPRGSNNLLKTSPTHVVPRTQRTLYCLRHSVVAFLQLQLTTILNIPSILHLFTPDSFSSASPMLYMRHCYSSSYMCLIPLRFPEFWKMLFSTVTSVWEIVDGGELYAQMRIPWTNGDFFFLRWVSELFMNKTLVWTAQFTVTTNVKHPLFLMIDFA
jgi:hypothetical protein